MTIRFLCPSGHSLSVPDDWAGRMVRCAACKMTVYVPAGSEGKPSGASGGGHQRERWSATAASGADDLSLPPPHPVTPSPPHPLTPSPPPEPTPPHAPPSPTPRLRSPRRPSRMPPGVYRPDAGNVATVKWLALILGLLVAFSIAPVVYLAHFDPATAPDWARVVLAVAVVQAAYIAWMLNAPDWASVWVVMLVFAGVSALYAVATAVAVATPLEQPIWLDMGEVRRSAGAWCGAVLSAMSLATYLCGRTATKWRRTFELQTARKNRPRR